MGDGKPESSGGAAAPATMPAAPAAVPTRSRLRVEIEGVVQGVGFRPFVYRLAARYRLGGWVRNDARGVVLEVEGAAGAIGAFQAALVAQPPPRAHLDAVTTAWLPAEDETGFAIVESEQGRAVTAPLLSDAATCVDCLTEVESPGDRRYRYPFTNCTNCGPRYSIVHSLPYDRPRTTMAGFPLCASCEAEYKDPLDRRFHAQPLACPVCGPSLSLLSASGTALASGDAALREAGLALRRGEIVAVKGLGGFQLLVDAASEKAVARLRTRKRRFEKPLALMVRDLAQARALCSVSHRAEEALGSPESPIVLLPRQTAARIAPSVAPGSPDLGIMLPTTPLHHLLLREAEGPVVATSGNLSEEPICTSETEALSRLAGIADLFLVHDRPIARHVDDSVAWIFRGELRLLRRARGFAPLPVPSPCDLPPLLGTGGHLKNAVALGLGRRVVLSQHVGDLETPETVAAFERVIADLLRIYAARPVAVAHDLHPDYASTLWALASGIHAIGVQHHHAHLAACLADNGTDGSALGVAWDGAGYGPDRTIWGGEFLVGSAGDATRLARMAPFPLPGGDAAAREPRRAALGLLWEAGGEALARDESLVPVGVFTDRERDILIQAMRAPGLYPRTSSAGRLFDGIAALLDLRQRTTFEGQAAMALEWAVDESERDAYPLPLIEVDAEESAPRYELDWRPLVHAVIEDRRRGLSTGRIAARFHNALAGGIVAVARLAGERCVALTGGCFLNRRLAALAANRLEGDGYRVLLHSRVPPGDGGIALGQVMVAAARLRGEPGRLR